MLPAEHDAAAHVPLEVLVKLRLYCLDLPEAYEETAWVGTQALVTDSYRVLAPKKLAALVDS